ncbi:SRPBCC family protein [Botryobacter ruber]|uniref:SRPBCC family protein n=1 Tax=Botryobacter ruber TaxID=2171629 RepID=UPI000E0A2243|nr:SRPBCC family protein [Botryobacter ruber]
MKWLAKLLILLLVAAVALGAYSFTLPATCVVEYSTVLQASPERIITYLNNPTQWENWSVWSKRNDPDIVHMYGGPLAGAGARHSWISDKCGSGQRVFTESNQPFVLTFEQTAAGETDTTAGTILLEKVPEGTRLVWRQTTSFDDNKLQRLKRAWRKYKTGKEVEQGLSGLQALLGQTQKKSASR